MKTDDLLLSREVFASSKGAGPHSSGAFTCGCTHGTVAPEGSTVVFVPCFAAREANVAATAITFFNSKFHVYCSSRESTVEPTFAWSRR